MQMFVWVVASWSKDSCRSFLIWCWWGLFYYIVWCQTKKNCKRQRSCWKPESYLFNYDFLSNMNSGHRRKSKVFLYTYVRLIFLIPSFTNSSSYCFIYIVRDQVEIQEADQYFDRSHRKLCAQCVHSVGVLICGAGFFCVWNFHISVIDWWAKLLCVQVCLVDRLDLIRLSVHAQLYNFHWKKIWFQRQMLITALKYGNHKMYCARIICNIFMIGLKLTTNEQSIQRFVTAS